MRAIARYCAHPKLRHGEAARDVLGSVRRTSWLGISLEKGSAKGLCMQSLTDAGFASKAADRRSVSGGVVMCCVGPVAWFSRRTQKCVTTSTTERGRICGVGRCSEGSVVPQAGLAFLSAGC